MSPNLLCEPAYKMLQDSIKRLKRGQCDDSLRRLIRLPDTVRQKCSDITPKNLYDEFSKKHSPDLLTEAVLRFIEGLCSYRIGRTTLAAKAFEKSIRLAKKLPANNYSWALISAAECSLSLCLLRTSHINKAIKLARSAANIAREHNAYWLEGSARSTLSSTLRYIPGQRARSRATLEDAHRLLSMVHPLDVLSLATVNRLRARLAIDAGKPSEALILLSEARKGFSSTHQDRLLAHSRIDQGWAHFHLRSMEIARQYADEALRLSHELTDVSGVVRAKRLLGWIFLDQNKYLESVEMLEDAISYARSVEDLDEETESAVALAWVHLSAQNDDQAAKILKEVQPVIESKPFTRESLQWQTLSLALVIRKTPDRDVSKKIRKLKAALNKYEIPRLKAECMSLVGFQLAQNGNIRDAAAILKDTLSAINQSEAAAWTDKFLSKVSSFDVRQWIASLVTEIAEHSTLAEQYQALRICSIAGLHDVKNLATSVYSELELLSLQASINVEDLQSIKDSAFRAGKLASEVEQQIILDNTSIVLSAVCVDIGKFLKEQQKFIDASKTLGKCTLSIDQDLPKVLADERFIARVFGNLKSNAEKYAPGSDIFLSAATDQPKNPKFVIVGFGDNGPGIDPEDAEIIFNAFKNANEYRQKRINHGTGFGLHYCKLVVEAHGGSIWVDPRPGKGAKFYFSLPIG